jgi:hypothetical protein
MRLKDLTGQCFGELQVLFRDVEKRARAAYWMCICSCGKQVSVHSSSLVRGLTKSCGHLKSETTKKLHKTHGMTRTPEYQAWSGMITRCENAKRDDYPLYGGRGIKVCDRWRTSFENFYTDMGPRPSKKHSLDRYPDKNGDYAPNNCRWATREQQARNKRSTVLTEALVREIHRASSTGESLNSIAKRLTVSADTVRYARNGKSWSEFK